MAKLKSVDGGQPKDPIKVLPADQLVQLNQTYSDAILAGEKHSHAVTKVALVETAARARMLEAQSEVQNFFATKQAAEKRHKDLTQDLLRTHNLTDKHAIDPLTGTVILPES